MWSSYMNNILLAKLILVCCLPNGTETVDKGVWQLTYSVHSVRLKLRRQQLPQCHTAIHPTRRIWTRTRRWRWDEKRDARKRSGIVTHHLLQGNESKTGREGEENKQSTLISSHVAKVTRHKAHRSAAMYVAKVTRHKASDESNSIWDNSPRCQSIQLC